MNTHSSELTTRRQGRACGDVLGALILALSLAGAGCAKTKAATVADGPPLAVPSPPPRLIAPVEHVAVVEPPAPAPAPEPAAPIPPRSPASRATAKPEPKADAAPVAAQPAPAPPAAVETREVRAAPAAAAAAEERKVKELMAAAERDLNRVDYRKLSSEGKSQYDQSKRFSEQALAAIKERNFVYALTLADKAATLAAELAGVR